DGDGDLDLAVLGFYVVYNQSAEDLLLLLLNDGPDADGNWSFTTQQLAVGDLTAGSSDLAWGDFDGDGDHDLAVGTDGATAIYRNDAGTLTPYVSGLPGYFEDSSYTGAYDLRSLTWADADNDGDMDLLVPSVFDFDLFEYRTVLLRNDGSDGAGGWIFTDSSALLDATVHAQSAWADDDGDGDLDLLLVNVDPYLDTGFIRRFGNDGGSFTVTDLLPIRVEYGQADWGDYDADGDMDLLVAGNLQEADGTYVTALRTYRNDGAGYFETSLGDENSPPFLDLHAASWADYDSDGDMDILVTGSVIGPDEIEGRSAIFVNDGGAFVPAGVSLPAPISSVGRGGTFTWLDLDGDGDLDYLVAGAYYVPGGNGLVEARIHLYRNESTGANAAPSAPSGLTAVATADGAFLSWNAATDDHTATGSLTYDLEVWRLGEPVATVERLPEPGSVSAVTSWNLRGLAPGTYSWHVCAVDSSFAGSAGSQGVFTVGGAPLLFADGFESGDTSAWSQTLP
ncbi:MAG: VCBS repeat-containing protein, partial [Acidobacteria bacterium]|nr:VCBS repeat-containing protein [Acidobacteriota bacterium]